MTGTRIGLDCLDTVVFSLLKCAPFIDFIVSKPKSVYIILTDSIVSIERLKSTRISYISYRIPSQFLEVSIFLSKRFSYLEFFFTNNIQQIFFSY
jgi:hypothetical protein